MAETVQESSGRGLFATVAFAVLLASALAGCSDDDWKKDWRNFRFEFTNDSDEHISYQFSAYVYDSIDKDDPREKYDRDGNRPVGPFMWNGAGPGDHDEEERGFTDWSVYSFEVYLWSQTSGQEFREFPVDAEGKCPNVDPVALKVRARDDTLGGVVYDYDFNC